MSLCVNDYICLYSFIVYILTCNVSGHVNEHFIAQTGWMFPDRPLEQIGQYILVYLRGTFDASPLLQTCCSLSSQTSDRCSIWMQPEATTANTAALCRCTDKPIRQTHRDRKITEILKSLLSDVEQKIMCKPVIPSWMERRRNRVRRDGRHVRGWKWREEEAGWCRGGGGRNESQACAHT